jgi:hypothetical protein
VKLKLTEEIWKEGNMYVSYCPELDIASCGEDVQQAKKNLYETILINIQETQAIGTFQEFLNECGIESDGDVLCTRKELIGFSPLEVSL